MVSGDVINTLGGGSFTPAAGVQIIVLTIFNNQTNAYTGITDGVTIGRNYWETGGSNSAKSGLSRMGITNAIYFYSDSVSPNGGWSGIQIT
jgi:hypothetical protein|tara:strand:- start:204 stop:476 length:273 start_codon:yes stop_codon:yes gene_type:complete